jgi:hypothetical protein
VTIPEGRTGEVLFEEDWGVAQAGGPDRLVRCALPRARWNAIANLAKQALNERLKEQTLPAARWLSGENRVERLLGKEVVVLAWAVEAAEEEDLGRCGCRLGRAAAGGTVVVIRPCRQRCWYRGRFRNQAPTWPGAASVRRARPTARSCTACATSYAAQGRPDGVWIARPHAGELSDT